MIDPLRALVSRMRDDRARFKIVYDGADVVLATTVDEWANELDTLLSASVGSGCTCWLGTSATYGDSERRKACRVHGGSAPVGSPPPQEVWEVWQGNTLVCSARMGLTEYEARNKVENERRNGWRMEARPYTASAHDTNHTDQVMDDPAKTS